MTLTLSVLVLLFLKTAESGIICHPPPYQPWLASDARDNERQRDPLGENLLRAHSLAERMYNLQVRFLR
jgi:hypothetical protein